MDTTMTDALKQQVAELTDELDIVSVKLRMVTIERDELAKLLDKSNETINAISASLGALCAKM